MNRMPVSLIELVSVVFLIESHFTGQSALDSVTGKFGDAVAQ
jgi:hypothetical protein